MPALTNAGRTPLGHLVPESSAGSVARMQRPPLPLFSPVAPLAGLPGWWVDRTARYAGGYAPADHDIVPAKQAVAELAGR
ncbi:hypothetical protein [Nocardia sp. CA-119907]|uniref:hypothetical protein n=1 Tax=Nocardia sp. CA-119907 TaxID=3239973 RepID=UPI003D98F518